MEGLLPELRGLISPRLKGKLHERQRTWMLVSSHFTTVTLFADDACVWEELVQLRPRPLSCEFLVLCVCRSAMRCIAWCRSSARFRMRPWCTSVRRPAPFWKHPSEQTWTRSSRPRSMSPTRSKVRNKTAFSLLNYTHTEWYFFFLPVAALKLN